MIFDQFANLKYKYGNRHFWCRGYYVDTVGRNKTAIEKYIRNQIEEDKIAEEKRIAEEKKKAEEEEKAKNAPPTTEQLLAEILKEIKSK